MASDAAPAQMPAGLQEILSEPGWELRPGVTGVPDYYEYSLDPPTFGRRPDVVVVRFWPDHGWQIGLYPAWAGMGPEVVHAASGLMKRIEQALAQSGGAGEGAAG